MGSPACLLLKLFPKVFIFFSIFIQSVVFSSLRTFLWLIYPYCLRDRIMITYPATESNIKKMISFIFFLSLRFSYLWELNPSSCRDKAAFLIYNFIHFILPFSISSSILIKYLQNFLALNHPIQIKGGKVCNTEHTYIKGKGEYLNKGESIPRESVWHGNNPRKTGEK